MGEDTKKFRTDNSEFQTLFFLLLPSEIGQFSSRGSNLLGLGDELAATIPSSRYQHLSGAVFDGDRGG